MTNHKIAIIVSPNWKDYAERFLETCLTSLRAQSLQDFQLYLIDNESSEESFAYLKEAAPEATIVRLEKNEGFAGGNNAALRLAIKAGCDFAFLINMDALVEKNCVEKLIAAAQKFPQAAAIQPRIMLWPEKDLINSLGNETHFLGFGYCKAYRQPYTPSDATIKEISYASGAAVLYRLSVLEKIGLYDEMFWMYNEDQDICLRMNLAGYQTIIVPEAIAYHAYEFGRSIAKFYWLDRNRLLVIFKHYKVATLLLLLPTLLVMELGLILFSLKSGWFKEKIKVWGYFLSPKTWSYIGRERHCLQASRVVSDKQFTRLFSGQIWYQEVDDIKLRLINPLFSLYWKIVRLLMFW